MYRSLGCMQSCIPFPLHLALVEDSTSLSTRQSRVGVPEIRSLAECVQPPQTSEPSKMPKPISTVFKRYGAILIKRYSAEPEKLASNPGIQRKLHPRRPSRHSPKL